MSTLNLASPIHWSCFIDTMHQECIHLGIPPLSDQRISALAQQILKSDFPIHREAWGTIAASPLSATLRLEIQGIAHRCLRLLFITPPETPSLTPTTPPELIHSLAAAINTIRFNPACLLTTKTALEPAFDTLFSQIPLLRGQRVFQRSQEEQILWQQLAKVVLERDLYQEEFLSPLLAKIAVRLLGLRFSGPLLRGIVLGMGDGGETGVSDQKARRYLAPPGCFTLFKRSTVQMHLIKLYASFAGRPSLETIIERAAKYTIALQCQQRSRNRTIAQSAKTALEAIAAALDTTVCETGQEAFYSGIATQLALRYAMGTHQSNEQLVVFGSLYPVLLKACHTILQHIDIPRASQSNVHHIRALIAMTLEDRHETSFPKDPYQVTYLQAIQRQRQTLQSRFEFALADCICSLMTLMEMTWSTGFTQGSLMELTTLFAQKQEVMDRDDALAANRFGTWVTFLTKSGVVDSKPSPSGIASAFLRQMLTEFPRSGETILRDCLAEWHLTLLHAGKIPELLLLAAKTQDEDLFHIFCDIWNPSLEDLSLQDPGGTGTTVHRLAKDHGHAIQRICSAFPRRCIEILKFSAPQCASVAHGLAEFNPVILQEILKKHPESQLTVLAWKDPNECTVGHVLARHGATSLQNILALSPDLIREVLKWENKNKVKIAHELARFNPVVLQEILSFFPEHCIEILGWKGPTKSVLEWLIGWHTSFLKGFLKTMFNLQPAILRMNNEGESLAHWLAQHDPALLHELCIQSPDQQSTILGLVDARGESVAHRLVQHHPSTLKNFYECHLNRTVEVFALKHRNGETLAHFCAQCHASLLAEAFESIPDAQMTILGLKNALGATVALYLVVHNPIFLRSLYERACASKMKILQLECMQGTTVAHGIARHNPTLFQEICANNSDQQTSILRLKDAQGFTVAHAIAEQRPQLLKELCMSSPDAQIGILKLKCAQGDTLAHWLAEHHLLLLQELTGQAPHLTVEILQLRSQRGQTVAHRLAHCNPSHLESIYQHDPDSQVAILSLQDDQGVTVAHILAQSHPAALEKPQIQVLKLRDRSGATVAHQLAESNAALLHLICALPQQQKEVLEWENGSKNTVAHTLAHYNGTTLRAMLSTWPESDRLQLLEKRNAFSNTVAHWLSSDDPHNLVQLLIDLTPPGRATLLNWKDHKKQTVLQRLQHDHPTICNSSPFSSLKI